MGARDSHEQSRHGTDVESEERCETVRFVFCCRAVSPIRCVIAGAGYASAKACVITCCVLPVRVHTAWHAHCSQCSRPDATTQVAPGEDHFSYSTLACAM